MKEKLLTRVWLLATPWTTAYQAPPSMGFSRQSSLNFVLSLSMTSSSSNLNLWTLFIDVIIQLTGNDPDTGRLKAGEGDDRGWDGWMVSPVQWTWTWANFRRWWGTERPGMPQSMGSHSRTWYGNWTTTSFMKYFNSLQVSLSYLPIPALLLLLLSCFSHVRLCATP